MGQVTAIGIVGNVGRLNHLEVDDALVLDAVGQILDVFGSEEIVATVAHGIGDIDAHGIQRIQTIAAAGLQVAVLPCQRVQQLQQRLSPTDILHIADGVRRIDVDIVGNLGLLGIAGRMQLITCRRSEIAVVVQDGVNHIDTCLRIDTLDENRLGGKMLV